MIPLQTITPPKRLLSIDILRALTMLLMIFVNDVSGVQNIPSWIEHTEAAQDGMGFADTIFPAFLFIVGLSLPIAISNRMKKGQPFARIALYIVSRSVALLIMGFFHVNGENYSDAAFLSHSTWTILVTLAFFLIWLDYPPTLSKAERYSLIMTGILLLLAMAYLYEGGSADKPETMKPHWWGILGIIGWAYFVCAAVFLFTKGKLPYLLIALAVFALINISHHAGWLHHTIPVIGEASSETLVMGGAVVAILYNRMIVQANKTRLWIFLTLAGVLAIAAGFAVRPFAGGISKIYATPAWVFICAGITILVFELIVWLVDVHHKQNWFKIIKPAGTSTLTCYLLPYFLYSLFALVHFNYPAYFNEGTGGIIRSFAVAFFVIIMVGLLEKIRVRLKI